MMRSIRPILVGALLLACGCTTLEPIAAPEAAVVDLRFTQVTVLETSAVFTIRLSNTNPFPLPLDGAVYRIWLNGVDIGKGMAGETIEVPRLSSVTHDVPVHFGNLGMLLRVADIVKSNEVKYRLSTTLYLVGDHGRRRISSSSEGQFKLDANQARLLQPFVPVATSGISE